MHDDQFLDTLSNIFNNWSQKLQGDQSGSLDLCTQLNSAVDDDLATLSLFQPTI